MYCSFCFLSLILLFFLKGLEQKLAEALHSILSDDKQGERVALYRTTVTYFSLRWVAKLVRYRHGNSSFAHFQHLSYPSDSNSRTPFFNFQLYLKGISHTVLPEVEANFF